MSEDRDRLQEKSLAYKKLAKILEIRRDPWHDKEINKVIASTTLSDAEKIRKIESLDAFEREIQNKQGKIVAYKVKERNKGNNQEHTKETIDYAIEDKPPKSRIKDKAALKDKSSAVESLKTTLYKKLFPMLYHYSHIKAFSKKTNLITIKRFPANFELELHSITKNLSSIKESLFALSEPTSYIIKNNFFMLTKEEYNLIYLLSKFSNEYLESFSKDYSVNTIKGLKKSSLRIIGKHYYKQLLENSFAKALKEGIYSKDISTLTLHIENIRRKLIDIFIALDIEKTKKYVGEEDFIKKEDIEPISKNAFKADEEDLNKIKEYVKSSMLYIGAKEKEVEYLAFIKKTIKPSYRNPNLSNIKELLSNKNQDEDKIDPLQIQDNIALFTSLLLGVYLDIFREVTLNYVNITTKDNRSLKERVFPYDMEERFGDVIKNHRLISDMTKSTLIKDSSFDEFKEYLNKKESSSEANNKLYAILDDISNNFYEISKRLYTNYSKEEEIKKMSRSERIKLALRGSVLSEVIPYSSCYISLRYFSNKKTIKETYLALIEFCIEYALLYQNPTLIESLDNETRLDKQLNILRANLKRMN